MRRLIFFLVSKVCRCVINNKVFVGARAYEKALPTYRRLLVQKSPRFKACVLAVALAATPLFTQAAGLGRLNVLSGLGQPFRGEIDLVSVQPNEADSLVVSLAPPESYSNARIEFPPASLGLRFNIEKRANGQYYVVINSAQPISEPFLDLLIELNWAEGRIQREYTALIDPADYAGGASADKGSYSTSELPSTTTKGAIKGSKSKRSKNSTTTLEPAEKTARPAASSDSAAPAPDSGSTAPAKKSSTPSVESADASADAYKVRSGDTLGAIARKVQPSNVSLEQVLVGLYRANPAAFDGNMNRLKSGKILNVPAQTQFKETSKADAAREIQIQAADWNAYRSKLAESAGKGPAKDLTEQSSGGKITAKVQDQGAGAADANKDVLKLSKAADAAKKSSDKAKQQALEAEAIARQKALEETNQRVAALQKNVADMEKLAAMKAAASEASKTSASASDIAAVSVPLAAASSIASVPDASEVASAVATAKPKRRIPVQAPVVEEPSFIDGLLENSIALGGGALALLLGGLGVVWARRRQKPSVFEDSIITGGDLKANTVLGSTGGGVISTQATENSFLTDFSRQGLGTIDTDEVDPIAEAEVYMAYGRDAQAEEILKDALQKDPSRYEIRMKLLDIYAARHDATSYEEHASALFAITNGQGDLWHEAAANGRTVDPENPLYRREPAGVVDTSKLASVAAATPVVSPVLDELTAPDPEPLVSSDLDFELDFAGDAKSADSLAESANFDLPVEGTVEQALEQISRSELDFDVEVAPALDEMAQPSGSESEGLMALDLPIDTGSASDELAGMESLPDLDLGGDLSLDGFEVEASLPAADLSFSSLDESVEAVALPEFDAPVEVVQASSAPLAEVNHLATGDASDLKLDFEFELPGVELETAADHSAGLGDISLDLNEAASAAGDMDFAADDPVQTKIDLAKAYIDMGDVEGAREILQEAVQEGNEAQQGVAKSLLDDL
ncbi:FimV/HubP family polar landmark protein [Chitinibacter sp. S2-10]|uniref:FimV/HubP family polar landmark protein n=1 Tax=Chitinibacter sp. S2-10 TaxID=3373597 RepID=UPI0039778101